MHKAVPGDISKFVYENTDEYPKKNEMMVRRFRKSMRRRPFDEGNDWRTCGDAVYRLLMDGRASAILHAKMGRPLRHDTTIKPLSVNKRTHAKALETRVTPPWRKVVMVVDAYDKDGVGTTDFHFFAQYTLPLRELYNVRLETMLGPKASVEVRSVPEEKFNVYVASSINAFAPRRDIVERHLPNLPIGLRRRVHKELLLPGARASTNLSIHLRRMPDYALGFVPRPFWLLDVDPARRDVRARLRESANALVRRFAGNTRASDVVKLAYRGCLRLLRVRGQQTSLSHVLGPWAEKAGWASGAMNADGSGKLLLDPRLADRDHGAYDYDTLCAVVQVLEGKAMTSVPTSPA